jgi:hypothetical protein
VYYIHIQYVQVQIDSQDDYLQNQPGRGQWGRAARIKGCQLMRVSGFPDNQVVDVLFCLES